ncbi:divalent metal cation transporter [Planosporangium thailandense]|uniref:Divalent metal cation transporter n=1 Tax=Planosporangium thailandense TaxID=765197 RepID=A0ABX0Y1Q9_9ACTN|nr:divalent metal cation transporter [Planosporangium thailandense]NJC72283.1 divalent metal cation transporter [Planosporangium thailandense]
MSDAARTSSTALPTRHDDQPTGRGRGLRRLAGLALGVLAGVGGFVDMGGVITSSQAGAQFRYALLWTVIPGIAGFAIYAEMSGRVVIASGRATFDLIRDRLGARLSLLPLAALSLVNVLTLVVEICGMALAVQLLTRVSYLVWVPLAALALVLVLWRAGFEALDNAAALCGLVILITVVAAVRLHPEWGQVGRSLFHPSPGETHPAGLYLFSVVSLLGAYMTPYQFEFYSSGALEQSWTGDDLVTNRSSAIVGTIFGGVITIGLMVAAAQVLHPAHAQVRSLADAAKPVATAFGEVGLVLFGLGTFAVSAGAGLETALSGTYSVCQYFGWDWGKQPRPHQVPLFHLLYLVMFVLAAGIALTGVDPIALTILTMALAAVALPFTFIPLLIVANDRDYVGEQTNTRAINAVAGIILALLIVVAVAAVPLLIVTGGES